MRPAENRISACVTAGNEEAKIARCLASLTWCDEIVVVDSFSRDRTAEICRRYTDRVYQHEWLGYIAQKNLIRGMAQYPWILFVDADEEVSDELRNEIQEIFQHAPLPFVGFQFPRLVYYLGKWIRHGEWYPDMKLRLFLKERGHSAGQEPHDRVVVEGPVKTLRSPVYHFTYDSIFDHLDTINRFSSISANEKFSQAFPHLWVNILFRPWWRFIKCFLLKRGFLDGPQGLFIAMMTALGVLIKYAKLWELYIEHGQKNSRKAEAEDEAATNE